MLVNKTVKDFVELVASDAPAPGGGSVSGAASALGAGLAAMVGSLTIDKKAGESLSDSEMKELKDADTETRKLIDRLVEIVDEDANAFNGFMDALKLPKETDEEKATRKQAMQDAMKDAVHVPFEGAERSLEALKLVDPFIKYGNQNAITDAGVASLLTAAGIQGFVYNVLINLGSIDDEAFNADMRSKCDKLVEEAKSLREKHEEEIFKALA